MAYETTSEYHKRVQELELEIKRLRDAIRRKQLQAYECTVCKKYFLAIGIMDGLAPKCYGCWQQTR